MSISDEIEKIKSIKKEVEKMIKTNLVEEIENIERTTEMNDYFRKTQEEYDFRDDIEEAMGYICEIYNRECMVFFTICTNNKDCQKPFKEAKYITQTIFVDFVEINARSFLYHYIKLVEKYNNIKTIHDTTNDIHLKGDLKYLLEDIKEIIHIFKDYYKELIRYAKEMGYIKE